MQLTEQDVLRVAADAKVDPRTVRRAVETGHVRSRAMREQIAAALRTNGHADIAARIEVEHG